MAQVQVLWQGMTDSVDKTLSAADLQAVPKEATAVSFTGFRLKEWSQIGRLLAAIPSLSAVSVI